MKSWSRINGADVDLGMVEQGILQAGRPVQINSLARAAVRPQLEAEDGQRRYTPREQCAENETIRLEGHLVTVKSVHAGSNRKEGCFKILTLLLPDRTEWYMAAEVAGAPTADRRPVTSEHMNHLPREYALATRNVVHKGVHADDRSVWCQNAHGHQ